MKSSVVFYPLQPTKQRRASPAGLAKNYLVHYQKKKKRKKVVGLLFLIGWMDMPTFERNGTALWHVIIIQVKRDDCTDCVSLPELFFVYIFCVFFDELYDDDG